MTGSAHLAYLLLRSLYEGSPRCVANFLKGYREGTRQELKPTPKWNGEGVDTVTVER
jgi:hypothetical protein